MKTDQATVLIGHREEWVSEEEYFRRKRSDPKLQKIEKKWSDGASPTMLVKCGYVKKEDWEKCFWLNYPSTARCHECPNSSVCPSKVN